MRIGTTCNMYDGASQYMTPESTLQLWLIFAVSDFYILFFLRGC